MQQVEKVTPLDADATMPFVGQALRTLRQEVRRHPRSHHNILSCSFRQPPSQRECVRLGAD